MRRRHHQCSLWSIRHVLCALLSLLFALLHFILIKILQSVGAIIPILQMRHLQFQKTH